ncbi:uncharacterized protein LOC120197970 isoform X2 [Hibiscus syriacus]|uniref:uncharacterized protein LOC120197970 isoform X2 n=1 Tax=Hibiscus syriacus TaxID=106335 RepID=UPI001923E40B|nr:uncharacterized protein LOC120197970 isoform X2 [Hibiscus syriacus]
MDSGNSSSMQSSSGGGGGDDEYDSVTGPESVPAFLDSSGHFNPLSNQHPSLVVHQQDHQPSTFFDPSANYLNNPFSLSPPSNSLLNFEGVRPRMSLRSEPKTIDLGNLSRQSLLGSHGLNQGSFPGSSSMQSRSVHHDNGVRTSTQSDQTISVVKNPKKRTRASRRAPTTVLTTDTTNFRAMVQEFTGIPAPPFSGSSYSRRLDLFVSGSASRSSHLEPLGSSLYPLRPSAKRVQTTPFASSSSPSLLNNPLLAAANTSNTTMANAFNPSSSNYQIPSDVDLLKQPQNMSNLQNQSQTLLFQSFLDAPPPLHPSLGLPGFGVKSQGSSAMPSIDELGFRHGNASLGGLQNRSAPEAERSRSERNWSDHGVGLNDGNYGSNNSQGVNSCKLNYPASSSAFHHHDKGLENVSSRAEGTVDSWICPAE